ncbi:hypothetical protein JRQ81_012715 [Phrynocephalus forsythii]|uniref:Transposase n=1 Tax=Phrynocephalus forsythii TaxID=171643 RepID=A0A9Q1B5J5_9SAUR|nr:hypothetical protein JRQ81_012715 [Phrynocephalus forsythii]
MSMTPWKSQKMVTMTSPADWTTLQHLQFKEVLLRPPYSPNLAPCDFYLFAKMKEHFKAHHFHSDDTVKAAIQCWYQQPPPEFSYGFA